MAEGRHVSKEELEEMERRKRMSAEIGEDNSGDALPGEHEQESDLAVAEKRTRLLDPIITANPD